MKKRFWQLLLSLPVFMSILMLPNLTQAQPLKTGLYLTLIPSSGNYNNEVKAGKDNAFYMQIMCSCTESVTEIKLSAYTPEGWTIEFSPDTIANLSPGSNQTVNVNIKPPSDAAKGERINLIFIAKANEITTSNSIFVTVASASYWLWIGIGIGIVVIVAFIFIFMRFNRQS